MSLEALTDQLFIWVSRYLAGFCLVSIALWGVGTFLWQQTRSGVRDALVYFAAIGGLVLLLAVTPRNSPEFFWRAATWFSVPVLIVLELLWISFLVELLLTGLNSVRGRHRPPTPSTTPTPRV